VKSFGGLAAGRPQNGTQAHDLSRELEFVRPAQVGATPFWDRPAAKPCAPENSIRAPFGGQKQQQ
jgi:hypothetical protein